MRVKNGFGRTDTLWRQPKSSGTGRRDVRKSHWFSKRNRRRPRRFLILMAW
jgi:hypothetical protein